MTQNTPQSPAENEQSPWLRWARRLRALGETGLHFGESEFDHERYQEVADIAAAMLADLASVPVEQVNGLLASANRGYATPQIDVRGALVEDGRVLLVQEKVDGCWTFPGGYADVGLSAAENVEKEVREEAGLEVRATRLYCVRHKTKHEYRPDIRDFYKFFFLLERRESAIDAAPAGGLETRAAGFYPPDAIPPLSTGRIIEADVALALRAAAAEHWDTVFD